MSVAELAVAKPRTHETHLRPTNVSGHVIGLSFNTLPGNNPSKFANSVYIWQNSNQIPWGSKPLNMQQVGTSTPDGDLQFKDLDVTVNSYIIGYAVGPDVTNICASSFVPKIGDTSDKPVNQSLSISVVNIGANSLAIGYNALQGYAPSTAQNWLGLWESSSPSYTVEPQWKTEPDGDSPTGVAAFNNITIVRGGTYTVAYFMGPKQTTMAATLTFTV